MRGVAGERPWPDPSEFDDANSGERADMGVS